MAGEYLIFDAAASAIDGTNPGTALNAGPGTNYAILEFDASAPAQSLTLAGSVDTEGSLVASRKHENRAISLKVRCATAAALRTLQAKIALISRESGHTLTWILPNAETLIFDLHAADTFEPVINKLLYVRAGAFCEVQIVLPAAPYGRGTAVTSLTLKTATSKAPNVFTETGIKGDIAALASLRITSDTASVVSKYWAIWGIQSRNYDAAASAGLFWEAESGSAIDAALNAGPAGASGGGANKTMFHQNVAGGKGYQLSSSDLTHVGSFVMLARVQALATNTGIVSVWTEWQPPSASAPIANEAVPIVDAAGAALEGAWVIVNLGQVTIPRVRLGSQHWNATIRATSTIATDDVHYDWVTLVPVDEGWGIMSTTTRPLTDDDAIDVSDRGVLQQSASSNWESPEKYEGDYLRLPPAGAEARTLRVVTILTGGDVSSQTAAVIPANNLEADTAQIVSYIPRYLVVPEP
jgi:hypothetical protein